MLSKKVGPLPLAAPFEWALGLSVLLTYDVQQFDIVYSFLSTFRNLQQTIFSMLNATEVM